MRATKTKFQDVLLLQPNLFEDSRGYFFEIQNNKLFRELGIDAEFVQSNHSGSNQGVLRGLHYQIKQAQGKLVRVIIGEVYDVIVDLRTSSQSFGQWEGFNLNSDNKTMLWVPPGFAHGFYTLSKWAELHYMVTDYFHAEWERTLLWNDPDLSIDWPLNKKVQFRISEKDMSGINY